MLENESIEVEFKKAKITLANDSVDFSNKILKFLKEKIKSHNKDNIKKISFAEICELFCSAAESYSLREDHSKNINQWTLARINGYLNSNLGPKLKYGKNFRLTNEMNATSDWQPSLRDYNLADEEIKSFELTYIFSSIDDLYIKQDNSRFWFDI